MSNETPTIREAVQIIDSLNDEFIDRTEEGSSQTFRPFLLETCGFQHSVKFFGVVLWDSENDYEREDGQSLTEYLRYEANKIASIIGKYATERAKGGV